MDYIRAENKTASFILSYIQNKTKQLKKKKRKREKDPSLNIGYLLHTRTRSCLSCSLYFGRHLHEIVETFLVSVSAKTLKLALSHRLLN